MIGMAKMQLSTGEVLVANYNILLSPSNISVITKNGGASSPIVRPTIIDGVGPYTYLWEITGSNITIPNPVSENVIFQSGGFNVVYEEVATLTITDIGNADAIASVTIPVTFEFENMGV